ncbi:uncharacterized protein LOC124684439 isoform X2 [Lolium rigidum]|uniref:uncharacterized protein LOC124684439 isoform X2 n=1 Tax=Lolium rigidum TaxID=89674 RepID=UPI001F5C1AE4|nr:uncharacterized protein LOC124684439 isoform X2 [Lolium rigidum]
MAQSRAHRWALRLHPRLLHQKLAPITWTSSVIDGVDGDDGYPVTVYGRVTTSEPRDRCRRGSGAPWSSWLSKVARHPAAGGGRTQKLAWTLTCYRLPLPLAAPGDLPNLQLPVKIMSEEAQTSTIALRLLPTGYELSVKSS